MHERAGHGNGAGRAGFANGHGGHPSQPHAPLAPQPVGFQGLPSSLPQTVALLIQLGAERNMQASQMQGLTNRKNSGFLAPTLAKLDKETELCWVQAGRVAETLGDSARALSSYETALRHSPFNIEALTQTANILRQQEKFVEAAEYFTRIIHLNEEAGEVWGALGHCYLMIDDLPKAYACYQQAIMHIPDAKVRPASFSRRQTYANVRAQNEPKLWYGIGILYDRYGSLEHAEEAFASVIQTDPSPSPSGLRTVLPVPADPRAQTLRKPTRFTFASASSTSSRRTRPTRSSASSTSSTTRPGP
jgi:glucose repression mediator protein